MKNKEYWKKRMKALEDRQYQKSTAFFQGVQEQYRCAINETVRDIEHWYQRLADNNGISLVAAKRLLKKDELEEFRWSTGQYIKAGQENAVNQRWMKELENASAKYHISYLQAMKFQMQQHMELLAAEFEGGMTAFLNQSYGEQFYHMAFEIAKGTGIGSNLSQIDMRKVELLLKKPWAQDGKNFSNRIWADKDKLIGRLHTELSQSMIRGSTPDKAIENLSKVMNVSRKQAGRLVMTESAALSARAQQDCFRELGVKEFEVIETLDSITCEYCKDMDGKHFSMSDFRIGETAPPFHPYCRGCICPYFEEDFGQVGERAAMDKETGKTYYVPADMTYQKWKETFVDGGDKSGLDVYDQNGMVHYKRLPDTLSNGIINSDDWQGINYSQSYSKKTAISRLQSEYGIQFHDSKKYAMDGGLLTDCVGWLDSFNGQYSGFMQKNPCKIPVIDNKAPSKMKGTVGYYSYYSNSPSVVELALNGQYHSDVAAFQKYVEQCVKSKWYPENATIHKTFVHEFGHHVSNSMRWITNNPNWQHEFLQECINDFKKVEPNYTWNTFVGMGDYVSRYGAKSESELFAEAFAEYFGGGNPREFAKIFGKKLDGLLKGVK